MMMIAFLRHRHHHHHHITVKSTQREIKIKKKNSAVGKYFHPKSFHLSLGEAKKRKILFAGCYKSEPVEKNYYLFIEFSSSSSVS
jgi:hypothetical protein